MAEPIHHADETIMTRQLPFLNCKAEDPGSPKELFFSPLSPAPHQTLPVTLFPAQTPTLQTVCHSSRAPQPLATQSITWPQTPVLTLKQVSASPAIGLSPNTLSGPPPVPALNQTQNDDAEKAQSEVNNDEIIDISENETEDFIDRDLLEELDAIAQKAYDEDTYSDVEKYPDSYWEMEYETEDSD